MTPLGRPALTGAREIPVLGKIAAGKPILAEENFEGFLTVAGEMARGEVFALRVKGDSMIEAGILEGDWVIVKCQQTAADGEIVCALIEGETTLKRFYKDGDGVTLRPENKSYPAITVSRGEFRILGKVIGLTRKF